MGHFTGVEMRLGSVIYEKCTFSIFVGTRSVPPGDLFFKECTPTIYLHRGASPLKAVSYI